MASAQNREKVSRKAKSGKTGGNERRRWRRRGLGTERLEESRGSVRVSNLNRYVFNGDIWISIQRGGIITFLEPRQMERANSYFIK